jgi:teichuronic acid biosynthesis glycosyltransferase TuaH
VLIGPAGKDARAEPGFKRLLQLPNVSWIPLRDWSAIPLYMRALTLGLLPYREVPYNRGVFPLKLFEYFAAGLPVVGCGLPSTVRYASDGAYIHGRADAATFVDACELAMVWTSGAEKRRAVARSHDWHGKFEQMMRDVTAVSSAKS